jgi:hypothetical protein
MKGRVPTSFSKKNEAMASCGTTGISMHGRGNHFKYKDESDRELLFAST